MHQGGGCIHGHGRDQSDQGAVQQAEQRFLHNQRSFLARFQIAQRESAQGDGQHLATGVGGLADQYRHEHGEYQQPVDGVVEQQHNAPAQQRGEQIELQPRVTQPQAAEPRRGKPFLLLDTHHDARLGAQLQ